MTYSSGSTILATDFNSFYANTAQGGGANCLGDVWGVGSGTKGWGQGYLGNVAAGTTVSATYWAALVANVATAGQQTGATTTTRTPAPTAGTTVTAFSTFTSDLGNITAARGNATVAPSAAGVFTGAVTKTAPTGSSNTAWTITFTDTITFANTNAARYFFNAGGQIKIMYGKTGGATNSDGEWNTFVAKTGNIFLSGNVNNNANIGGTVYTPTYRQNGSNTGVTQTALSTTTGFYNLTTSQQTLFQLTDGGAYGGDYIRSNAAVDNASTPSVITLTTVWNSAAGANTAQARNISGGTAITSPATSITGAAVGPTVLVNIMYPATTYLANTWGSVSVVGAVV
jgi:hypothetical protein